ncbi:MAG: helix-turn-helix domain-containing protein [Eubacterium sp.]|nr:helix-turn-helix domain-containing protein [Eubacterium sp.]
MNTKEILLELRKKNNLTQDELAEKLFVTRQAVSRWESGETIPNSETLKLISGLFDISINTLLGAPRKLICQCCGMPLDESSISKEQDGSFNEEYCKWCYNDGEFVYTNLDVLINFLAKHMSNENLSEEQARLYFEEQLPKLNYWRKNVNND